ncbi:MAG: fumarylacetoacetate hydrolase family protein [Rhodospirillaceae bacterium]
MKLATYMSSGGQARVGLVVGNDDLLIDLQELHEIKAGMPSPYFASMLALIEGGDAALGMIQELTVDDDAETIPISSVKLLAPIPRPPQIRDCLCFETHLIGAFGMLKKLRAEASPDPEAAMREIEEKGLFRIPEVFYEQPIYYKANRFSVIGSEEDILWPSFSEQMDYEFEFGCFIKSGGKNIPKETAHDHIFGYSIFNDVSARDTQFPEMSGQLGPGKCKDFDTGNVIGPWIVTADEFDPYAQTMTSRINGADISTGDSGTLHWNFADLIAHISREETLYPGEFLASGTVGGGCGLEHNQYLNHGDVIELEMSGLGTLRNRIIKQF